MTYTEHREIEVGLSDNQREYMACLQWTSTAKPGPDYFGKCSESPEYARQSAGRMMAEMVSKYGAIRADQIASLFGIDREFLGI